MSKPYAILRCPLKPLLSFDGVVTQEAKTGITFGFKDYLTLVDWTGRAIRDDKRGNIPNQLSTILERFSIEPDIWLQNSSGFEARYRQRFQARRATTNSDAG
jgi:hypothetical protein